MYFYKSTSLADDIGSLPIDCNRSPFAPLRNAKPERERSGTLHLHPETNRFLKRIIRFFLYGDLVLASFQFGSERGRCVHSRYNPVISFFHPLARAEERNHAVHIAIAACRSVCYSVSHTVLSADIHTKAGIIFGYYLIRT